METIAFYSYKGGVGRTLALANIAIYLSRFGQNVCIMDFDLEAPGLHYKFPKFVKTNDIKRGLVDYIYEFAHNKVVPRSLTKFSLELMRSPRSGSRVQLIPAGNVASPDYWQKLASIDWHSLFYEQDSQGTAFFLELKERIRKELSPDFLLIDSRTGITEMSGLCTSLLSDKVVFLIINNGENIDGARQILRSIQRVERFPKQKPIDVTFALTRIPLLEENGKIEREIVKSIQDFLNEPVEDLESQLSIQDICILHSDRELELSESLRISQEGITKETPLLRDYLRLFSRIIPDEAVLPELDSVLEEIVATANLFEDPDKTQQELEGLVAGYLHPKSLEKLIDFYILRNAGRKKILGTFSSLWETFGIDSPKTLSKYVSLFMKWELSEWDQPEFELAIVEKFLESSPRNKIAIERRLAGAYKKSDRHDMALKHYLRLLGEVKEKNEILGEILGIYIEKKDYGDAMKLCEEYSNIIDSDASLLVNKAEAMFKADHLEEVRELLDDGGITETAFLSKRPFLYISILEKLGEPERAKERLDIMINEALAEWSAQRLYELGGAFYQRGRADDFRKRLSGRHPEAQRIIADLDSRYGYRRR